MKTWVWDACAGLGLVLVCGGVSWIYPPAGMILAGIAFVGVGAMGAYVISKRKEPR